MSVEETLVNNEFVPTEVHGAVQETVIDHEMGIVSHDRTTDGIGDPAPEPSDNVYLNTLLLALAKRVMDTDAFAERLTQLETNLKKMFEQMGHGKTWASFTPTPRAVVSKPADDSGRDLLNEEDAQAVLKIISKE